MKWLQQWVKDLSIDEIPGWIAYEERRLFNLSKWNGWDKKTRRAAGIPSNSSFNKQIEEAKLVVEGLRELLAFKQQSRKD